MSIDSPKTAGQGRGKRGSEVESAPWAYVSLLYGDEFLLGLRVLGQSLKASGTRADRCRSNPTGYSNYFRAGWMEGLDV